MTFRSFTGGNRLEAIAHERLGELEKYLDARLGQEVYATTVIDIAILGILTHISFGYE